MCTYGLRWYDGFWHVHLMWQHWQTHKWESSSTFIARKYKRLENAINHLKNADCVMIFPV